jgi:hypothetical protein
VDVGLDSEGESTERERRTGESDIVIERNKVERQRSR